MEIFLKYVLPALSIFITLGIPFIYVFRTEKNAYKGILLTWVLNIFWFFVLSSLVYNVVAETHGDLIEYVPEANSVTVAIMSGWFTGIIISGLAILARRLVFRIKPSLFKNEAKSISE